MFSNIGIPGLIIILVLALIVFGPSKLPEIGKAFGRSLKEFKDATRDIVSDQDAKTSSTAEIHAAQLPTDAAVKASLPTEKTAEGSAHSGTTGQK